MKDRLMATGQRIGRDFLAFTPGQKVVSVVAVLGVVIGGYLFSTWTSKVSYAPLYTNLAAADASSIVDKLTSAHESYQLADNGTTILVPTSDVYKERLAMSSAGLPSSGQSAFSLLDHEGVTTSDFVQHVDYQRALETELDSTIGSISGVQNAQVNLAIPQDSVFTDSTQKTTGAVLVALSPGTTLTTGQVRSVVNLVASSVPGLTADNVSVSDTTGKVLSAAGSGVADTGALSSNAEATQAYDTQLGTSVQQMLDRVVGVGHSAVTVNAVLNFDQGTTTSHNYVYTSGVPPLAVQSQSENYNNGSGNGVGGTLGVGTPAATDTASATPTGTAASNYSNTSVTQNNAVGSEDKTTVTQPGAVQKLGVSVVVDKSAVNAIDPDQLKSLVSSAVGLDANRGDTLAIATLPFDTSSAQQASAAATAAKKAASAKASSAQMLSLIKTGGIILIALAIVVVTALMSRRRRNEDPQPASVTDNFLAELDGPAPVDMPREPAMREIPLTAIEMERNRRTVTELAGEQPEDMTRLLRNWMNAKG